MSNEPRRDSDPLLPILLQGIQIPEPCPVRWDEMTGDERSRHCAQCDKAVYDLSQHTAAEAVSLVYDEGACVQIQRDRAGKIVTKDSLTSAAPSRRSVLLRFAQLAASWLGLAAIVGCEGQTCDDRTGGVPQPGPVRRTGGVPTGTRPRPNPDVRPSAAAADSASTIPSPKPSSTEVDSTKP